MARLNSKLTRYIVIVMTLLLAVLFMSQNISAADKESEKITEPQKPIHITSDQLFMNNTTREAEFRGNVKATQENTVIYSDSLQICYKKDTAKNDSFPNNEQSIDKIIAKGNVKINFDNRLAEADQAIYTAADRVLVLTGKNCKLTSESNTISGEKIIFYRDDGRIFVESGQNTKRVEAVISANGKGLN
jgi:lipopolysaccharide export system protein LptA